MPVKDGFQTALEIHKLYEDNILTKPIPVIAATAMVTKKEKDKCSECHMKGYLLKPILVKQLK